MALDTLPADGAIYPGTNLTWTITNTSGPGPDIRVENGKYGQAMYFDGRNQRVVLGTGRRYGPVSLNSDQLGIKHLTLFQCGRGRRP